MAISKKEMLEVLVLSLKNPTAPKESKLYILKSAWDWGIVDSKESERIYEKYIMENRSF